MNLNFNLSEEQKHKLFVAVVTFALAVAAVFGYDYSVIQPREQGLGWMEWAAPAPDGDGVGAMAAPYNVSANPVRCKQSGVNCLAVWNGSDVRMYSDGGTTQKFYVDGATGNLDTEGIIDASAATSAATSEEGANVQITQSNAVTLTGTLRGGYFVATNGTTEASGTIRGLEAKARAANPSNVGAKVATLEGASINADPKNKDVTLMRGAEIVIDGAAGSTVTTTVGIEIDNNSSGTQTASYAYSINQGTASGHKSWTADLRLQNGETIDNATDGTVNIAGTSPVLAIGGVGFSGPIKYGTAATYTSGAAITHGFTVTPTMCMLQPTRDVTSTLTIGETTFSSDMASVATPIYWMCGK